ncbi:replication initiator protein WhiP [Acidianus manzaensis]|uniref:Replication initiator protein WhiP n=2 Tax=Acidianus manzaensis TaxID=282676 RepID=A0A1W6K231_9CREN|nr:replication initiator protein WhiP [Acidianus manzaensis]ARM76547.1 replication initiator protein WhiP [Acidianus manzaensis]
MDDSEVERLSNEIANQLNASPRSKLMEAIIVLLNARPLRTSEIASNLGYQTKYISSYLSYWKKKNLVYQDGGRWYLTPEGENLAKAIIDSYSNSRFKEMLVIAKQMVEQVKDSKNNKTQQNKKEAEKEVLSFIDSKTNSKAKKQQNMNPEECVKEILEKLDNDEKDILLFIIDKYKQWGSTYIYIDQLQEEYKADMGWLFKILRQLQTKRILYLYQDPKLGLRIGFSKTFKEKLNC